MLPQSVRVYLRMHLNPFSSRFAQFIKPLQSIQSSERLNDNPTILSGMDYSSNVRPISYQKVNEGEFSSGAKVIGYIIDKQEIHMDGTIEEKESVILTRSQIGAAIDTSVKYGSIYSYSIRAIALIQLLGISHETGELFAISTLISSRPSKSQKVACIERVPPPPPADIKYVWDYEVNRLNIIWSFPTNPQRDIKRFQVFRRATINDPF